MREEKSGTDSGRTTHPAPDAEHVAVMPAGLPVLGHVGKEVHVVAVLTRAEDVGDFMITDHFLQRKSIDSHCQYIYTHTPVQNTPACWSTFHTPSIAFWHLP